MTYNTKTKTAYETENRHIAASKGIISPADMRLLVEAYKNKDISKTIATCEDKDAMKNVAKWKKWVEKKYAYEGKKNFTVSEEMHRRIQLFAQKDDTHFNEFLEYIVMMYLDGQIKKNKPKKKYKMYKASKSDDIASGVDYIIRSTDETGEMIYQGIDLGLGENKEAQLEKGVRSRARCLEFNIQNDLPPDATISRVFLGLDKYLVYSLANECLQTIFVDGELDEEMVVENFEYAQTSPQFKKFLQGFCDTRASVESTVKEFNFQIMSIIDETKKGKMKTPSFFYRAQ